MGSSVLGGCFVFVLCFEDVGFVYEFLFSYSGGRCREVGDLSFILVYCFGFRFWFTFSVVVVYFIWFS